MQAALLRNGLSMARLSTASLVPHARTLRHMSSGAQFNAAQELFRAPKLPTPSASLMALAAGGGLLLWVARNSFLMTDAGVTYVVQNQLTGSLDVYTEPGLHRRVPFFSSVTPYKQVITVNFEGQQSITARFADTYMGSLPVTFRFKLPLNP